MPHITIDSSSDIQPLFNELCKIVGMSSHDVRITLLDFKGANNLIDSKSINMAHIITICEKKGFKFNFKLVYEDIALEEKRLEASLKESPASPHEGLKVSDVHKKMEQQASEIRNPDLQMEHVTQILAPPEEKKATINPKAIPNFD